MTTWFMNDPLKELTVYIIYIQYIDGFFIAKEEDLKKIQRAQVASKEPIVRLDDLVSIPLLLEHWIFLVHQE